MAEGPRQGRSPGNRFGHSRRAAGWPLGLPLCRSLGDGLWEVRSSLAGGRIARVIFAFDDGTIVLLNGFIKKTRKTPPAEIDLALKRLKEMTS